MGPRFQTLSLNEPQSLGQPAGKARGTLGGRVCTGVLGGCDGCTAGRGDLGGHGHASPPLSCWASGTPRTAARSCGGCCAPTARASAPAAT